MGIEIEQVAKYFEPMLDMCSRLCSLAQQSLHVYSTSSQNLNITSSALKLLLLTIPKIIV